MNLNIHLQQLDLAKLDLHRLNDHYIADHLNEQEKELYLTMVSSFVLFDDLTEARTRLFGLYLNSCKTKLQQGKIFNLAQNISKEQIKEFSQLCVLKELKNSFLIDAFIFLRLDVPLSDRKNILLSEWINLLKINQENLEELLYIVSEVLGIKHDFKINSSFNLSQANIWKEFILRELTLDQLKKSELQGFWLVKKDIEVNFNCSLSNINLYFENNSFLKFKENLEVKLIQSKFHNSLFDFNKVDKLLIDNCSFIGNYDVKKKLTVLKINEFEGEDSNCEIRHSYFETKDAQAISATCQRKFNFFRTAMKKLSIENTKFNHCGNKLLLGGVAFLKDINFKFKEVTIENCIALVSGGIYTSALYEDSFESVNFKDCYSCIYQKSENIKNQNDIKYNGSALFSEHVNGSENLKVIRKTNFDNANLFIAAYSQGYTFEQCKFIDSILGLKDYWDQAREMKSCEFLKGDKNLGSTFEYLPDYKLDKLHLEAIEQQSSDSPKSNQQFF